MKLSCSRLIQSKRSLQFAVLIGFLTGAVMSRVVVCDFINYDDPEYVTDNRIVQKGPTLEGLSWAFAQSHGKATYWHPLTWISHMLDCELFGLNPAMHHLINLILHAANSALLFLFLLQATQNLWPSFAVALLFGVHPLQVDTVAWVAERKNLLTVLFALLCLLAYARYVHTGLRRCLLWAVLLFAGALMCKPAVVILPAILLLLDYWPLSRLPLKPSDTQTTSLKRIGLEKLPFLGLSLGSAAITIVGHARLGILTTGGAFSLSNRVQNSIVAYGRYLRKLIAPTDLAIHYPHPGKWPVGLVLGISLLLIFAMALAVTQWRRRPWLLIGWLWFVGSLLPTIGLIQVGPQSMADRFMYFPIIGLGIAAAWSVAEIWPKSRLNQQIGLAASGVIVVALSSLTIRQIGFWRNSATLWEHALAVTPNNYISHINLSDALFEMRQMEAAFEQARIAALLKPTAPNPWCLMGKIYNANGNALAAITNYQRAAELDPNWADIPLLLAQAYEQIGNGSAAREEYERALTLDPISTVALNNLAWMLATNPDYRVRNGAEAVRRAGRACELTDQKLPIYIGTLAAAYAENGQFEEAAKAAQRAADRARVIGDDALAKRNLQLKDLYTNRRPYREQ